MLYGPVNRRAVLIALGKNGDLDTDRSFFIRTAPDAEIRRQLKEWNVSPEIQKAAGIPLLTVDQTAHMPDIEIQRQVNLHLTLLELDLATIEWVTYRQAVNSRPDAKWAARLLAVPMEWSYENLPRRIAAILLFSDEPEWKPMFRLIEHNVHPYGPASWVGGKRVFLVHNPLEIS